MDRDEALELLQDQHGFPGPYLLRLVVHAGTEEAVLDAVRVRVERAGGRIDHVDSRASSKGAYLAVHVGLHVQDAALVLDLYELVKSLDGVVTAL